MHSPKRARSRHVSLPQAITTPSKCPRIVSTGRLSDEVLLNIFRHYLEASPRFWLRLVHVCRKWRSIIFASQRALNIRLYCTHGTHVPKTLDCWPSLPIVVQYGGSPALDPPAPEDENDIMAALKQSDRIGSISLTVTRSLLEKLSAIESPFSELEDLVLLSRDRVQLILPNTFRWGPRLRSLYLTRTSFTALPQLLYSSKMLVYLQLHEVSPWRVPPEALTDALSGTTQLQSLSLHLLSIADDFSETPPSGKRIILPALTRLNFRGMSEYSEDLAARIDAPRLGDIEVTLFDTFILNPGPQKLIEFIRRIEMHKSIRQAHILSSERAIIISLTSLIQPGAPTYLKLQSLCEPWSDQLLSIAQICLRFSSFLFDVEDLHISATRPSSPRSCRADSFDIRQWPKPINSFTGVKWFHLDGNLATHIVRALQPGSRRETVLPALYKLRIPRPGPCHAPLPEAVVSLMTFYRLSGRPIAVEYEQLYYTGELRGTGPFSRQVTIETLYDDIILNIFRHYLDSNARFWPTLAWVCQRWRQIVFTSPLGLNIRLHCTYGTPVLKTLDCWPALPLLVDYGGPPPAPEDEENIMAALKQSDRVSSISLTVTSSLLENLSTIEEPFSELEELILLSRLQLTLPSAFRWGARLRTLHLRRVAIPAPPRLLSLSTGLVDLQLHQIHNVGYLSPDVFANALSDMTQLATLSLHFLSLPPRRNYLSLPPPPGERIVFPALTHLKYRGTSKYLDALVARIDAPRLTDIRIKFFNQPTMDASQLGRFIERTGLQTSLSRAKVETSAHAIYISFYNSSTSSPQSPVQLQISCEQLDWQLFSMAQVCDQFSRFLFLVEGLRVNTTQSSSERDDMGGEQWVEIVRTFGGAKDFCVAGGLATNILRALGLADGEDTTGATVLPALRNICVQPKPIDGPLWDAAQPFITSRRLSSYPVELQFLCHICDTRFGFTGRQEFKTHLVDKHAYRYVCSYCSDFEWSGYNDLFPEHLESKHPEVAYNDELFDSDTYFGLFTPSQLDSLLSRHSFPCAPDEILASPSSDNSSPLLSFPPQPHTLLKFLDDRW